MDTMTQSLAMSVRRLPRASDSNLEIWQAAAVTQAELHPKNDPISYCELYAKGCNYIDWPQSCRINDNGITERHLAMGMVFHRLHDSSAKKAILAFRGSVLDRRSAGAGASLVGNLDPLGVGWLLYQLGKREIQSELEKLKEKGYSVTVIGHSLGGALASYVGIYFNELVDKVYTFGSPGVSWFAARKWRTLDQVAQKKIENYWHPEDPVSLLGQETVGVDYQIVESKERLAQYKGSGPMRSWDIHVNMWLNTTDTNSPPEIVQKPRELSRWRYIWPVITFIPWLVVTIICALKIRIIGTKNHDKCTYLLGLLLLLVEYLCSIFQRMGAIFKQSPARSV